MTLSNRKRKNDSFNELEKNTKQTELEGIIKNVKIQIRKHYAGIKEQIERIGCVLKANKLIEENDICTEIKNSLREEINEKIILSDTIERCCPDEWKRKTKPKTKEPEPQLRILEGKNSPEQETGTNLNASVTSEGQILQQQQDQNDTSMKTEEQKPGEFASVLSNGVRQEWVAHMPRKQESLELGRLKIENREQKVEIENLRSELNKMKVKEEQEEEILTENEILRIDDEIQLAILITVNYRQKKIERVELDLKNSQ